MPAVKIKQNRFQMSYKKDEVPKYELIEQFLMEDLGVLRVPISTRNAQI